MSTRHQKLSEELIITSGLSKLLAERDLTQKRFASLAGVSERAISSMKNRPLHRIDCTTAARLCAALSRLPRTDTGFAQHVRLDALFPMVSTQEK